MQIVNEKGEWIGTLATTLGSRSNVIHHLGYTHERIANLVISLNAHRRHQGKMELAKAIAAAVKAEAKTAGEEFHVVHDEKIDSKRGRGRPKNKIKAEVVKRAAKHGVSKTTAERALASEQASDTLKSRTTKGKKERPFEEQVNKKWMTWLNRFPPQQRNSAMKVVHEWIGCPMATGGIEH